MVRALAFALMLFLGFLGLRGQSEDPLALFRPALQELEAKVKIPILLPRTLPFHAETIKHVSGEVRNDGYWISLYYTEGGSNASYAAGFGASKTVASQKGAWKLASGIRARFMPVSCGGSCAPANLWWIQNGVEYTIQLKVDAKTTEAKQRRALVDIANSMVPVPEVTR